MNIKSFQYQLVNPETLIPTEEINEQAAFLLHQSIQQAGRWLRPIIAHQDALFVMDGHHRLSCAKRLNLSLVPVVLLDYNDVDVCAWREGETITPQAIFDIVRQKKIFPYKTTRHSFSRGVPTCDIPLQDLKYHYSPVTVPAMHHQHYASAL